MSCRHPLQEQVVDTFVPNDALVVGGAGIGSSFGSDDGEQGNSVMLCTGANACGKVNLYPWNSSHALILRAHTHGIERVLEAGSMSCSISIRITAETEFDTHIDCSDPIYGTGQLIMEVLALLQLTSLNIVDRMVSKFNDA